MHITLISACERRAIRRSNAILDSYAIRTGEKSWHTPITTEAMRELRAALRRTATRQTAVACYVNEGMRRMRLLWVVGSQEKFGLYGAYPVGYTQRKHALAPDWLRPVALLARLAGLLHDLGKASTLFQQKLRAKNPCKPDPVRHEWISLLLYRAWREGKGWEAMWDSLPQWFNSNATNLSGKIDWLRQEFNSFESVVEFLIVSHHQLLGAETNYSDKHNRRADDQGPFFRHGTPEAKNSHFAPQATLPPTLFKEIEALHKRLRALLADKPSSYWWPLALQARAALIFADHKVSGDPAIPCQPEATMHANTIKQGSTHPLKQPLDAHLFDVARTAGEAAYQMATLRLPALSQEAVNQICEPAPTQSRFVWQNKAANLLTQLRTHNQQPVLLFNLAGTGSGKTRMNARAACLLGRENRIRFANVLNLRTLTLQTGDAFRQQLGIGADEMATVIGSTIISTLHQQHHDQQPIIDEDENQAESEFFGKGEAFALPYCLEHLGQRQANLIPILAAPVLVATIDYLIAAGEPNRQGHHVSAWLRLMNSDLILDEVDSYDPDALIAVLRLIQIAAMSGRNVTCSSATLALPVAEAIHRAFSSGLAMRQALRGKASDTADQAITGQIVLIDDLLSPEYFACHEDFAHRYQQHLGKLCAALGQDRYRYRIAYRQAITLPEGQAMPGEADWLDSISAAVKRLHQDQQWQMQNGKSVSFGLVRIANVSVAIKVAKHLLDALQEAQIACYHAKDFVIQRDYKEKRLDQLLNRKQGNQRIENDAQINALLQASATPSVPFIVVATPVEEIGRDHDFDWAVIEPSSTQSIVQTAGRVNRHRLQPCERPNIAILSRNMRLIRGEDIIFWHPGLETGNFSYGGDLSKITPQKNPEYWVIRNLIHKSLFSTSKKLGENLDARLRFETHKHPFAKHDDDSLREQLSRALDSLCPQQTAAHSHNRPLLAARFYTDHPLRAYQAREAYRMNEKDEFTYLSDPLNKIWSLANKKVSIETTLKKPWLALSFTELREQCEQAGIPAEEGLMAELPVYGGDTAAYWYFCEGLGFWENPQK
jgi:CRISPR-associated endonuclease/helicase Cas3